MNSRFAFFVSGVAGVLCGCGTLTERAEAVTIVVNPAAVETCELIGPVVLGVYESEFRARQRELKLETARRGGNVLRVTSIATATSGTAYLCGGLE